MKYFDMDTTERRLYDDLMLIAENDGQAYRSRDPRLAVVKAFREDRASQDEQLRENFELIEPELTKNLRRAWGGEAKRNIPRRAHRRSAEAAGKLKGMAVERQKRARARKDATGQRVAGSDMFYYAGAEQAHKKGAAGKRWPGPEDVKQEALFVERLERESQVMPNPPKKDGKWHRETDGGYALATRDGAIALVYKHAPRSKDWGQAWNSRHVAEAYEYETGQKLPRGTKWITRVYTGPHSAGPPQWSAHKTLQSAKRAGIKGLK